MPDPTIEDVETDERRDARSRLDTHLEQRQEAVTAAEAIIVQAREEDRDLTAEELQTHARATADILRHNEQVQALRTHLGLVEPMATVRYEDIPVGSDPRTAPRDSGEHLSEAERRASTPEYRAAFVAYLRAGDRISPEHRELLEGVQRAQSSEDGELGGYLVPTQLSNRVIETMQTWNGVDRAGATVITTENGQEIQFPTASAVEEGEIVGENDEVAEDEVPFGLVALRAYLFSSREIIIPRQLLQDAGIDLDGWLAGRLGRRIGRRQGRAFTTGSGASEPEGIVTAATVGETAAATGAVTYAELVDLKYSVDEAYRMDGGWMWNDTTLAALLKLTDGDSRPLINWDPRAGEPDTVLGDPFTTNNHMPEMEASAKSILYGDFSGYTIRRVRGVEVVRLSERHAHKYQVSMIGFQRADGALLDTGSVKALQQDDGV